MSYIEEGPATGSCKYDTRNPAGSKLHPPGITPYWSVIYYLRLGGACCLHLLLTWRRRQQAPPKRRYQSAVITVFFQKTVICINNTVKTNRTTFRLGIMREFLDYLKVCKYLKKESVSVTHFRRHDVECAKHCTSIETLSESALCMSAYGRLIHILVFWPLNH